jgi:arylsulfatase I/J
MTGVATKMAAAGYKTASFGKWDAGMATPDHTPHGRGYMTALNYFHHCNDYWSMTDASPCHVPSK